METEAEITIVTFKNLDRVIKNMQKTFAQKSIEKDVIKTEVSIEQPINQTIGDIWFVEEERN